jgi:hypothetical protein
VDCASQRVSRARVCRKHARKAKKKSESLQNLINAFAADRLACCIKGLLPPRHQRELCARAAGPLKSGRLPLMFEFANAHGLRTPAALL